MKIIFAGTPEFAVPTLNALLASEHEVIAVYTQPDRPAGRGQKITASPVKQVALAHKVAIHQPLSLRDADAQKTLQALNVDVMIVVAYGLILPASVLTMPRLGCINVHASLLPRWRGAAPIQRAILAGDTETGVTIMQMAAGLDTGPMLHKVSCPILPTDTSQDLHDRLAQLGATALLPTLTALENGTAKAVEQDESQTCYAKKIDKLEAEINWQDNAAAIERAVRAFNPWPIAHTQLGDQHIRVWQTEVLTEKTSAQVGEIVQVNKQGIDVAAGDGTVLRLLRIQLAGGRCLSVGEVLNAKRELFVVGDVLGHPHPNLPPCRGKG